MRSIGWTTSSRQSDALHLNLNYSRSWFQTPNSYDNLNVLDQFGNNVGNADQHSKIETFDIAPTYTRIIGSTSVFNFGPFIRKDSYQYFPQRATRWRTWDRPTCRTKPLGSTGRLPMPGCMPICLTAKDDRPSRVACCTPILFCRERDSLGIVAPKPSTRPA